MGSEHTPGPWAASGRSIRVEVGKSGYRGQGFDIAQSLGSVGDAEAVANANRIVACVNACEGIADPADLRAQRDELLAACREPAHRGYGQRPV